MTDPFEVEDQLISLRTRRRLPTPAGHLSRSQIEGWLLVLESAVHALVLAYGSPDDARRLQDYVIALADVDIRPPEDESYHKQRDWALEQLGAILDIKLGTRHLPPIVGDVFASHKQQAE